MRETTLTLRLVRVWECINCKVTLPVVKQRNDTKELNSELKPRLLAKMQYSNASTYTCLFLPFNTPSFAALPPTILGSLASFTLSERRAPAAEVSGLSTTVVSAAFFFRRFSMCSEVSTCASAFRFRMVVTAESPVTVDEAMCEREGLWTAGSSTSFPQWMAKSPMMIESSVRRSGCAVGRVGDSGGGPSEESRGSVGVPGSWLLSLLSLS
jgi:hypothetical protein